MGHGGHRPVAMTPMPYAIGAQSVASNRIKADELPSRSLPRPVGVERNLVVTVRDSLLHQSQPEKGY